MIHVSSEFGEFLKRIGYEISPNAGFYIVDREPIQVGDEVKYIPIVVSDDELTPGPRMHPSADDPDLSTSQQPR